MYFKEKHRSSISCQSVEWLRAAWFLPYTEDYLGNKIKQNNYFYVQTVHFYCLIFIICTNKCKCTHTHTHTHTHAHTRTHTHTCICVYVCMYVCTYACVCVCVFIYIYIYIYTHTHIYIYTHTHTHTHTYIHACTHTRHTEIGLLDCIYSHYHILSTIQILPYNPLFYIILKILVLNKFSKHNI